MHNKRRHLSSPELTDLSIEELRDYHRKLQIALGAVSSSIGANNASIIDKGVVGHREHYDRSDINRERQDAALAEIDAVVGELAKRILDIDK